MGVEVLIEYISKVKELLKRSYLINVSNANTIFNVEKGRAYNFKVGKKYFIKDVNVALSWDDNDEFSKKLYFFAIVFDENSVPADFRLKDLVNNNIYEFEFVLNRTLLIETKILRTFITKEDIFKNE
jgi:hypothetical protein